NGLDIQRRCAEAAIDIAGKLSLPLVATSDAHYLTQEDADAHDVLLCINTGKLRTEQNRLRYDSKEFFVCAPDVMYERFPGHQKAVQRSQEIADGCAIDLDFKTRHFPVFTPPQSKKPDDFLAELCEQGLQDRYGQADEKTRAAAKARLDHELGIICRM